MAQITKRGRELANRLAPSIGVSGDILETCSLIARHATTYQGIQEGYCNGHPAMGNPNISAQDAAKIWERYEKWLDKREAQIERRITELVESLPPTDSGPVSVRFGGDPRGAVVTLIMPDGRYDNWERDGFFVH